jgi:8-oxo-dGTP pyrophosphatase MutT (NUDIX family)
LVAVLRFVRRQAPVQEGVVQTYLGKTGLLWWKKPKPEDKDEPKKEKHEKPEQEKGKLTHGDDPAKEKEKPKVPEKWISAGGVVVKGSDEEGTRFVLLVSPKGKFGGYTWTFPKGRIDKNEGILDAARREIREETGIQAEFFPMGFLGTFEGQMSHTHFYMMLAVGGHPGQGTDGESDKVEWVEWPEAFRRIKGSSRDRQVLIQAWIYIASYRSKLGWVTKKTEEIEYAVG